MKHSSTKFIAAIFCLFATTGWEQEAKISGTYTEGGGASTPLAEKNYAQLYCESEENARLTMSGMFGWDWRLVPVDDYCHHKVEGMEDSFKNGWQRSRLFAGCKLLFNTFDKSVYRCYRFEDSAEYLRQQELRQQQAQYLIERSARICAAKEAELSKEAGLLFGDIDAGLELAREDEQKAAAAEQLAKNTAMRAQELLNEALKEVTERRKLLAVLANMYDVSFAKINGEMNDFFSQIKKSEVTLNGLETRLNNADQSYANLKSIQDETLSSLAGMKDAVCDTTQFTAAVAGLRGQVAHMQSIVDGLEQLISRLALPVEFAKDKDHLEARIKKLQRIAETRSAVFNGSFDMLAEQPYVCERFRIFRTELGKAVHLAKSMEDVKATVGVVADFKVALEAAAKEAATIAAIESVFMVARDNEAQLMAAVYKGEATKAKQLADNFNSDIEAAINQVKLASPAVDMTRIQDAVQPIRMRVQSVIESRLSRASAATLLSTRLRALATKIMRLDMQSQTEPDLALVWNMRKDEILTSLNTKVGQEIPRPQFTQLSEPNFWAAISEFETQLSGIEATLGQLTNATKR
ncbi:MAG: hypothetical protein FJ146_18865 [Deltaproteobacteria bacterium]|nr:hypothetical protein [Deltaproteobacteria bacterium]